MTTRRKYRPGPKVRSMAQLLRLLDQDRIIYWRHKPQNRAWLIGLPLRVLQDSVRAGILRVARPA